MLLLNMQNSFTFSLQSSIGLSPTRNFLSRIRYAFSDLFRPEIRLFFRPFFVLLLLLQILSYRTHSNIKMFIFFTTLWLSIQLFHIHSTFRIIPIFPTIFAHWLWFFKFFKCFTLVTHSNFNRFPWFKQLNKSRDSYLSRHVHEISVAIKPFSLSQF